TLLGDGGGRGDDTARDETWSPSFSLAKTKIVSPGAIHLPPYMVFCARNVNDMARGSPTSALIAKLMRWPHMERRYWHLGGLTGLVPALSGVGGLPKASSQGASRVAAPGSSLTVRVCLARLLRLADALAAERPSEGWIAILQRVR